jgi:rhodanese-related sulfurtransferase
MSDFDGWRVSGRGGEGAWQAGRMHPNVPEVSVAQIPAAHQTAGRLVDVREDDEWDAGHVAGAEHIRMHEIPARMTELNADQQVMVICRTGSRSALVTQFLTAHGLDAVNVVGGMRAWVAAGRPMESSTGIPPQVL